MPGPYHMDLRLKAIRMAEDGIGKSKICKMLCISRNTLWVWLCRKKETGSPEIRTVIGKKTEVPEGFHTAVDADPGITQARLGKLFGVSQKTAGKWLYKAGFTRKKNLWLRKKG